MSDIELKNLMVHVERIVRPVRATELRKLKMRREILSHLQAVLDEEMAIAADESAAWETTLRRLGDPAILTRELQKIVPLRERLVIWNAPKGGWSTPREARLMLGLFGLKPWTSMLFLYGCIGMLFGWWPLAIRHIKESNAMPLESWIGSLTLMTLSLTLATWGSINLTFHLLDLGAQPTDRRRVIKAGILNLGLFFAFRATWLLMGAGPWSDLLWMPLLSIPATAGTIFLGRFLRSGIRDFGEWYALKIA